MAKQGWPIEQPRRATARDQQGAVVLAAIPFGLAIGIALGMLGGGGSVLAVPILVYILNQSAHQATTASLVVVTAGALAGGLGHARESVCWRHAGAIRARGAPRHRRRHRARERRQRQHPDRHVRRDHADRAAATWRKANQRTNRPARQLNRYPTPALEPSTHLAPRADRIQCGSLASRAQQPLLLFRSALCSPYVSDSARPA